MINFSYSSEGGQRMHSVELPQAVCRIGGERILLPYRILQEKPFLRYYWPTEGEPLILVCQEHGYTSVYYSRDEAFLKHRPVRATSHNHTPTAFWKTEFRCTQEDCGKRVLAHTRLDTSNTSDSVYAFLLASKPGIKCARGHILSSEHSQFLTTEVVEL
jgi:hypothetical protein